MAVAEFLETSPLIEKVIYPGLKSFEQRDVNVCHHEVLSDEREQTKTKLVLEPEVCF